MSFTPVACMHHLRADQDVEEAQGISRSRACAKERAAAGCNRRRRHKNAHATAVFQVLGSAMILSHSPHEKISARKCHVAFISKGRCSAPKRVQRPLW